MKIEEKLKEVLNDLCDWIQKETKKASSSQAESNHSKERKAV